MYQKGLSSNLLSTDFEEGCYRSISLKYFWDVIENLKVKFKVASKVIGYLIYLGDRGLMLDILKQKYNVDKLYYLCLSSDCIEKGVSLKHNWGVLAVIENLNVMTEVGLEVIGILDSSNPNSSNSKGQLRNPHRFALKSSNFLLSIRQNITTMCPKKNIFYYINQY